MEPIIEYIRECIHKTYGEAVRCPCAFKVAETLGVERRQALTDFQDDNGPMPPMAMSIRDDESDRWLIYHDMRARIERQQFDVAHEIIEQFIIDQAEFLDAPGLESLDVDEWRKLAHDIACFFTKDLLINPDLFSDDVDEFDADLFELKRLYPNASWEVLAYATLSKLGNNAVLTILDEPQGEDIRIYRRMRSTMQKVNDPMLPWEEEAVGECFEQQQPVTLKREISYQPWNYEGWATLKSYPVFEKNWKRVILFLITEPDEWL